MAAGFEHIPWLLMMIELVSWLVRGSIPVIAQFLLRSRGEVGAAAAGTVPLNAATIISSFYWGYSLALVPSGFLAQRLGGRAVLALSLSGTALFLGIAPAAHSWRPRSAVGLRACLCACGVCTGPLMPGRSVILSQWVPKGALGEALTTIKNGNLFGKIAASLIFTYVAIFFGWQAVFYFNAILAAATLVVWLAALSDRTPTTDDGAPLATIASLPSAPVTRSSPLSLAFSPPILAVITCHMVHNFGSYTIGNFGQRFFDEGLGLDPVRAATFFSATTFAAALFNIIVKPWVKKIGLSCSTDSEVGLVPSFVL